MLPRCAVRMPALSLTESTWGGCSCRRLAALRVFVAKFMEFARPFAAKGARLLCGCLPSARAFVSPIGAVCAVIEESKLEPAQRSLPPINIGGIAGQQCRARMRALSRITFTPPRRFAQAARSSL